MAWTILFGAALYAVRKRKRAKSVECYCSMCNVREWACIVSAVLVRGNSVTLCKLERVRRRNWLRFCVRCTDCTGQNKSFSRKLQENEPKMRYFTFLRGNRLIWRFITWTLHEVCLIHTVYNKLPMGMQEPVCVTVSSRALHCPSNNSLGCEKAERCVFLPKPFFYSMTARERKSAEWLSLGS